MSLRNRTRPRDNGLRRSPLATLSLVAALSTALGAGLARAQTAEPCWPGSRSGGTYYHAPSGVVTRQCLVGDTLYVAGNFTGIGYRDGYGNSVLSSFAAVEATGGTVIEGWPRVTGTVFALASDGAGGWYLGGKFTSVGGVARANLAHVLADRSVSAWDPGASDTVATLVLDGPALYVGGRFATAGGAGRSNLAALDAATGAALAWNPGADERVHCLAKVGANLVAGGYFANVGGQPHAGLAVIDAASGAVLPWSLDVGGIVTCVSSDAGRVYVGGTFASVAAQPRTHLAAFDAASGALLPWSPVPNLGVTALLASGGRVYASGSFGNVNNLTRTRIAALDALTGAPQAWTPTLTGPGRAFALRGSTLYVVGTFAGASGTLRGAGAAFDVASGALLPWNPGANSILAVGAWGSAVAIGGGFTLIEGKPTTYLGAIDARTGRPMLAPAPNFPVSSIASDGTRVFVGGYFTTFGGQSHPYLAMFDHATGAVQNWGATPSGDVTDLLVHGDRVYITGNFTSVGGQPRTRLAALDRVSGALLPWNPVVEGGVYGLVAIVDTTIFVSRSYRDSNDVVRWTLTGIGTASGLPLPTEYEVGPSGGVHDGSVLGNTLYVAGGFTSFAGLPRPSVAAVDLVSGTVLPWAPSRSGYAETIAAAHGRVYVSGEGLVPLAAFDPVTGAPAAWAGTVSDGYLDLSASVISIVTGADAVYVGGFFLKAGGDDHFCLAKFPSELPATLAVSLAAPDASAPLLIGTQQALQWTSQLGPGIPYFVDLLLSRTGPGGPWEPIASGLPASGSFEWTVTGPPAVHSAYVRAEAHGWAGQLAYASNPVALTITDGIADVPAAPASGAVFLAPPSPNPAQAGTVLAWGLPRADHVRLAVLDVQGREIAVLADGSFGPGPRRSKLDTTGWPAGVYFARLRAGEAALVRRFVVAR